MNDAYGRQTDSGVNALAAQLLSLKFQPPISSVPNEILCTIFEAGCCARWTRTFREVPFELLVSHVAQRWRHVAIHTPQLWTQIHINLGDEGSRAKAETYLLRSGALPLDLSLEIRSLIDQRWSTSLVVDIIRPHVTRWRRLEIFSSQRPYLYTILSCLPPAAPLLERIHITDSSGSMPPHHTINLLIGGAPLLTSVRILGTGLHSCLPPLATVTRLQLYSAENDARIDLSQFASMLNGLSALVFLVISGEFFTNTWSDSIITLPSLQTFHFLTMEPEQMPILLSNISAPSLHTLLLENFAPSDIDSFVPTLDLKSKSSRYPNLRHLTIFTEVSGLFTLNSYMNVIRAFPTTTHFTIISENLSDFLEAFLSFEDSSRSAIPGWPDLDTLTLINSPEFDDPALLDLSSPLPDTVSACIVSGHPIKKIRLSSFIMASLSNNLAWLRARVDLEETSLYSDLPANTFFINSLDNDD